MSEQPKRIQRKRTKGWRMPEGAVYVGRPGVFGNPFAPTIIPGWATASRQYAVDDFRAWLDAPDLRWRNTSGGFCTKDESMTAFRSLQDSLPRLAGRDLACWCPLDQPCHADVLLRIANEDAS